MKKITFLLFILLTLTSCNNTEQKTSNTNTWSIVIKNNANLKINDNKMTNKTVEKGSNIAVSYTGSLEDGTIFDATSKHWWTPLEFTAGAGQMIKGFDAGVIGMKVGETKVIEMKASEAYGEYDENKKQVLQKKDLASFTAAWFKLEKGEKLPTQMGEFEIIETSKDTVTIDSNHALAGKNLTFEVKIEKIK